MDTKKIECIHEVMQELIETNEQIMRSVVGMLAANKKTAMLITTLYLKDKVAYEFLGEDELLYPFDEYIELFWESEVFRKAVRESGVLEQQITEFVSYAYDGYDLWYHLLDGIVTILKDRHLAQMLPEKDFMINKKLYELQEDDLVDEYTWDGWFRKLSNMYG